MNSTASRTTPATPAACSESCGFAEPLRGDYLDWIWCSRPQAVNRVRRVGGPCPASAQAVAVTAPSGFDPES